MTHADLVHALGHAFTHVYHQDHANAAMHCAQVRYSPITFRLAEAIHAVAYDDAYHTLPASTQQALSAVLSDRGTYEEDRGR